MLKTTTKTFLGKIKKKPKSIGIFFRTISIRRGIKKEILTYFYQEICALALQLHQGPLLALPEDGNLFTKAYMEITQIE